MSPCAAVRSEGGAIVMTTVFTVTEFYKQLVLVFSIIVNAWVHLWNHFEIFHASEVHWYIKYRSNLIFPHIGVPLA